MDSRRKDKMRTAEFWKNLDTQKLLEKISIIKQAMNLPQAYDTAKVKLYRQSFGKNGLIWLNGLAENEYQNRIAKYLQRPIYDLNPTNNADMLKADFWVPLAMITLEEAIDDLTTALKPPQFSDSIQAQVFRDNFGREALLWMKILATTEREKRLKMFGQGLGKVKSPIKKSWLSALHAFNNDKNNKPKFIITKID